MDSKLVSIIIPVYNIEDYLPQCLDSLLKQKYANYKIILVDDGSDDSSSDLCDEYSEKDKRISVFHLCNGGVSKARNVGIEHSSGEYITFIDGDDWVDPDYLEQLIFQIESNQADISAVGYIEENGHKQRTVTPFDECRIMSGLESMNYIGDSKRPWVGFAWGKLYRLDLLKQNHLEFDPDISICEDSLFNSMAMIHADKVVISAEALYHYRIREDSATCSVSSNPKKLKTKIKAFEKILSSAKKNPQSEYYKRAVTILVTTYMYYISTYCRNQGYNKKEIMFVKEKLKEFNGEIEKNRLDYNTKLKWICLNLSSKLFYYAVRRT